MGIPSYVVRFSPGKGNGVFATKPIPSGAIILTDKIAMQIDKQGPQLRETDVQKAFKKLSIADQKRFLELHEGSRPYNSKIFRIYKANSFGDASESTHLYLEISKLNHSCIPNAELSESALPGKDTACIVAIKPIQKDEEIFISYNTLYNSMTKAQRAGALKTYYGFSCSCEACSHATAQAQHLSDWRRKLINALCSALKGYQTIDYSQWEALLTMTPAQAETPEVLNGISPFRHKQPLTNQHKTAYNYLLARLYEAEGLAGLDLAICYTRATECLMTEMSKNPKVVILPSVEIADAWMRRAQTVLREARGKDSRTVKNWEKFMEETSQSDIMRGGMQFLQLRRSDPSNFKDVFAVYMGEIINGGLMIEQFTEKEYKALLRNGQSPGPSEKSLKMADRLREKGGV